MLTYEKILSKIKNGEVFSFSRFGDGEFSCIFGRPGSNGDGHRYFEDLGEKLRKIILSQPEYYLAKRKFSKFEKRDWEGFDELTKNIEWESTEIFAEASINGRLQEFFNVLKGKKVLYVANNNLLQILHFPHRGVAISYLDCWLNYELVKQRIKEKIDWSEIILYSAGMMSCILIDDFKDSGKIQIDVGSVFDPYVGIYSRGYMRKLRKEGKWTFLE